MALSTLSQLAPNSASSSAMDCGGPDDTADANRQRTSVADIRVTHRSKPPTATPLDRVREHKLSIHAGKRTDTDTCSVAMQSFTTPRALSCHRAVPPDQPRRPSPATTIRSITMTRCHANHTSGTLPQQPDQTTITRYHVKPHERPLPRRTRSATMTQFQAQPHERHTSTYLGP